MAADFGDLAADKAFVDYLSGVINTAMLEADPTLRALVAEQLTGQASEATLAAAQEIADRETKRWVSEWASAEINKMGDVIRQGIAEGLHPDAVARRLEMVRGLDSGRAKTLINYSTELADRVPPLSDAEFQRLINVKHDRLLSDRKRVIAQDQTRKATEEGAAVLAKEQGKKFKTWITVGDDRVSDECQTNEADGWIPVDDTFDAGAMQPPQHPRCRCTLAYRVAVDKNAADRAKARKAKTAAAKAAAEA